MRQIDRTELGGNRTESKGLLTDWIRESRLSLGLLNLTTG